MWAEHLGATTPTLAQVARAKGRIFLPPFEKCLSISSQVPRNGAYRELGGELDDFLNTVE